MSWLEISLTAVCALLLISTLWASLVRSDTERTLRAMGQVMFTFEVHRMPVTVTARWHHGKEAGYDDAGRHVWEAAIVHSEHRALSSGRHTAEGHTFAGFHHEIRREIRECAAALIVSETAQRAQVEAASGWRGEGGEP